MAMGSLGNQNVAGYQPLPLFAGLNHAQLAAQIPAAMAEADTFARQASGPDEEQSQHTSASGSKPLSTGKEITAFCKGLISPLTDPFKSVKNFLIATTIFIAHAAIIGATGGAAAVPLLALAGATAIYHVGKGGAAIRKAKTNAEKEKAIQNLGAGLGNLAMLGFGAKTTLKEGTSLAPEAVDQMSTSNALMENCKQIPNALIESGKALGNGKVMENTRSFMSRQVTETTQKMKATHLKVKNQLANNDKPWPSTMKDILSDVLSALSINSLLGLE